MVQLLAAHTLVVPCMKEYPHALKTEQYGELFSRLLLVQGHRAFIAKGASELLCRRNGVLTQVARGPRGTLLPRPATSNVDFTVTTADTYGLTPMVSSASNPPAGTDPVEETSTRGVETDAIHGWLKERVFYTQSTERRQTVSANLR